MVRQEFQAAVEGGVAGRDIRNEAPKFQIGGNVGTVHIHLASASTENPSSEQEVNRAVSALLRTCKEAGCLQTLQRISLTLFGNSMFKSLSIEQLLKLQRIADELVSLADTAQSQMDDVAAELEQAHQENAALQRQLDGVIADLKISRVSRAAATDQEQKLRQLLHTAQQEIEALRRAKPPRALCQTCSTATASLASTRRALTFMSCVAVIAALAAAYLAYEGYTAIQAKQEAEARLTVCVFEGKAYGLGSVLVREGVPDWRCTANNGAVAWEEIKSKRKR